MAVSKVQKRKLELNGVLAQCTLYPNNYENKSFTKIAHEFYGF